MYATYTDNHLLDLFITLNDQPRKNVPEIQAIRQYVIIESKLYLILEFLSIEWTHISNMFRFPELNKDNLIKGMIKDYLIDELPADIFIEIYNFFQKQIENAGDILYYLNPLKFLGNEIFAMNVMFLDSTLDYSGFISACKVKRIPSINIQSFIQRLDDNSNKRKYNKILSRQ